MQAGKLNQRLTLYRTVDGKSDNGAPTVQLERMATPWAELLSSSGSQSASNDREKALNVYQWRLRWRENIEPNYWIQWRGRWMKITAVDDADPQRRQIILDADSNPKSSPPAIKPVP
ncbi:phage head closure protein [Vibrio sp. 11-4(1)]|uniref:phage head closure protein n=1 Tax=Vibrio TaxID=662 RepID=UPI0014836913|nr:phage head closure protein [Vibrio sp. 11-4(1)]NNN82151.1 hypothetical protein [Vibrio sp. 11-4(1)]